MERPINPRHKDFLRLVAFGERPSNAYRLLYPNASQRTCYEAARRLLERPRYKALLEEYCTEIGARNAVVEDEIILNLRRARNEAFDRGNIHAAIRATEALARFSFDRKIDDSKTASPFQDERTQALRAQLVPHLKVVKTND